MTRSNRWPLAAVCLGLGLAGGLVAGPRLIGQPPAPVADPPVPRDWNSYAPVVKRVLPAVVSVEGKGKAAGRPKLDDPDPGFGSGFLIDGGVVVTNNHVVADTTAVTVTLQDGRKFTSQDIRRDPKADLAVIKLQSNEPLPFLEFGDSDAMEVGDRVLAVGAPFGLTGSVTQGIVSGKSRNLNLNLYEDFLQTDAAVNPGNSGGPLVNMEGRVVGLTSAIKTRSGGFQGVGLAVSSKLAKEVVGQLAKDGKVRRPYLGFAVRDLDDPTAAKLKVKPDAGVVVTDVFAGGPGAKANLGTGDFVTSVNNQPVPSARELQKVTLALKIGDTIEMLVTRDGKLFLTRVTVEEQPAAAPAARAQAPAVNYDTLGLAVTDLTVEMANRMGLPKTIKGVAVAGVTRGSLADQSGVARGMVVVQVDRQPVATADQFRAAVEAADAEKGAVLHVLRPTGNVDFVILRTR